MHRKEKRYLNRVISMILTVAMLLGFIDISYVRAEQEDTSEKRWDTANCIITYMLTDHWDNGYTATINIENTSDIDIENWHVSFSETPQIVNLWNAQLLQDGLDEPIFKNLGWNQDIMVGSSVSFGFTANEAFQGFPEVAELAVSRKTVSSDDYIITYQIRDDWTTGYVGSIMIQNVSDRVIEDWMLSFDLPYNIDDMWNGQILSYENGNYLIKNKTERQNIAAGEVLEIGFTVNSGNAADLPEHFCMEEYALTECTGTSGEGTDPDEKEPQNVSGSDISGSDISGSDISGDDVSGSDISGNDVSGGDLQSEILISINTDDFDLNEKLEMYLTQDKLSSLEGGLQGAERVERLSYSISDLYDLEVKSGEMDVQEKWKIQNIGLVLGLNRIKVTALSKDGTAHEKEILLMNFNIDNMKNTDVNMEDTDQDGIEDYFEGIFGTDPLIADTDGDGLSDREELFLTGTDPLMVDTDDNGVPDGAEDFDKDGLNNIEEMAVGTNAYSTDTDGDGLDDRAEAQQYHTDPLLFDTDDDGLTDGQDVKLDFNPLNPDTDGNGILDGDEVVYQTYTKELDQERKAGITQVSVSMDCAGYIDNEVWIQNAYNLDMRSTNVVGLFGAPVIIETEEEFDEATITFTYDEDALGEIEEDNLRIMWYDEENDIYQLLDEETEIDKEKHTLSCATTHFSTWMVIDRKSWSESIRKDLGYGQTVENQVFYYDFAEIYNALDIDGLSEAQWQLLGKPSLYKYMAGLEFTRIFRYGKFDRIKANRTVNTYLADTTAIEALDQACTLMSTTSSPYREIFFANIKDIEYSQALVEKAKANHIKINCSSTSTTNPNMRRIAGETGGKYTIISEFTDMSVGQAFYEATNEMIPTTIGDGMADTDGDGLPDIYEILGIRISNGQIVHFDPHLVDTDGNGISDFVEAGGLPKKETITIGGETYDIEVSRGGIYDMLSPDFIYVDGRENADGSVIDEKMEYVSYSENYYFEKYVKMFKPKVFETIFSDNERLFAKGAAGVHGLYANNDRIDTNYIKYYSFNTLVLALITEFVMLEEEGFSSSLGTASARGAEAASCFALYTSNKGGISRGCNGDNSRYYIDAGYMLRAMPHGMNSGYDNLCDHMRTAKYVSEKILNEHNTDVYIALSPKVEWTGCRYLYNAGVDIMEEYAVQGILNGAALGTFNEASASITLHCWYNSKTGNYWMEYKYYLIDFYDFEKLYLLYEQDALGIANSYELFGRYSGICSWKAEQKDLNIEL